jgi:hypothetical protein
VANVGLFVYVWHGKNMWLSDQEHLLERVDAPPFVPADQIDFWKAMSFAKGVPVG